MVKPGLEVVAFASPASIETASTLSWWWELGGSAVAGDHFHVDEARHFVARVRDGLADGCLESTLRSLEPAGALL
jgi:hypothetical protein